MVQKPSKSVQNFVSLFKSNNDYVSLLVFTTIIIILCQLTGLVHSQFSSWNHFGGYGPSLPPPPPSLPQQNLQTSPVFSSRPQNQQQQQQFSFQNPRLLPHPSHSPAAGMVLIAAQNYQQDQTVAGGGQRKHRLDEHFNSLEEEDEDESLRTNFKNNHRYSGQNSHDNFKNNGHRGQNSHDNFKNYGYNGQNSHDGHRGQNNDFAKTKNVFDDYNGHRQNVPLQHHLQSQKNRHTCNRPCSADPATRMTCSFQFVAANYVILSPHCMECPNVTMDCFRHGCVAADGRQKTISVVNKQMPGPQINVCEGDTVVVDLMNKLVGQETTIHWHGLHQRSTPWMDGVPNLTQCPIPQASTFRYQFETPRAGTNFWHSHSGVQRADGMAGTLVVRKARELDIHSSLYDFDLSEHEIIIWDWLSDLALRGYQVGHVTDERELPKSILVHGKGFPPGYFDNFGPYDTIQNKNKPFVPLHEIRVHPNRSYRLRLISNGVTLCPVEVSIEDHFMTVIASDGFDVVPVPVQSLVLHAGERFDVIVRADQPIGSYWLKFRGLLDCNTTQTFQLALFNYENIPMGAYPKRTISKWDEAGPERPGLQLNPVNIAPGIPGRYMTVAEMSSVMDDDPQITEQLVPDHQFYLTFDFNHVPNVNFGKPTPNKSHRQLLSERERIVNILPQMNFISHTMPSAPLFSQPNPNFPTCNEETKRGDGVNCRRSHCECVHVIKMKLNSIVEIVLVDMGLLFDTAHPFHLHGHAFRVVALERLGNQTFPETIKQWDSQGLIPRRRRNAPIKDTVYVPDGGYTILRFRANNPGLWFFHCHIEFHSERGMGLIFQVGNGNEWRTPPSDFPKCGNYLPPVVKGSQSNENNYNHPTY